MLSSAILLCVTSIYLQESAAECHLPNYNLSFINFQNRDGEWKSKVKLDDEKEHPVEFTVSHRTDNLKCTEEIVISLSPKKQQVLGSSQHTKPVQGPTLSNATEPEQKEDNTLTSLGYTFIDGFGYYKFDLGYLSWENAQKQCELDGAHLLILNSEDEANKIVYLPNVIDNTFLWVGVSDKDRNGKFVTIFGKPLEDTGFSKWLPEEPYGSEFNCVYARINDRVVSGLVTLSCIATAHFVCEKEVTK